MGAEIELTERLARLFGADGRGVVVGIGDDAAVVRTGPRTVLTTDPVVAGVHFEPDTPLRLVGQKAVNRNLSDLAAMGATADYLLVSVLLPAKMSPRQRQSLFLGIRTAARRGSCQVVGGDVAVTPGPLVVTVTAVGRAPARPLTRSGLRPGHHLHVTGSLGGAATGHHLRFRPRLREGRWLAGQRAVSAAIDISDGLLLDLWRMLRASGGLVGAVLEARAIPVRWAARELSRRSGRSALEHALGDGEDHELLFGVRPGGRLGVGGPLTQRARRPIGEVTAKPGLFLRTADGGLERRRPEGYEHDV
jgi:thiamine-monophosphate kinase